MGIESDQRVGSLRGVGRPVNNEEKRLQQLELQAEVDLAFILPQEFNSSADHLSLLELIRPQILAVSSHTPNLENKRRLMEKIGGEVRVVHLHNPEVSTTKILKKY